MNSLRQMAELARENADTARCLITLCLDMTDSLDAIVEAILRDEATTPLPMPGALHDHQETRPARPRS